MKENHDEKVWQDRIMNATNMSNNIANIPTSTKFGDTYYMSDESDDDDEIDPQSSDNNDDDLNEMTFHKLTRRILQQQDDWSDWQKSEFKQLDAYEAQNMFGEPTFAAKPWVDIHKSYLP